MLAETDRLVVGYHGTSARHAEVIVREGVFQRSENDYDWLGHGIYFWEEAPCRAWRWARQKFGPTAAAVQATVRLGRCLDLTDIRYTEAVRRAFDGLREAYAAKKMVLPANRGKARLLDCLVINYVAVYVFPECETVRAPFLEGAPIFDGSALLSESHIQVVVRKPVGIISNVRAAEVVEDCEA
jgi:hypothetical protein